MSNNLTQQNLRLFKSKQNLQIDNLPVTGYRGSVGDRVLALPGKFKLRIGLTLLIGGVLESALYLKRRIITSEPCLLHRLLRKSHFSYPTLRLRLEPPTHNLHKNVPLELAPNLHY